jgi:hypothetical protein
MPFEFGSKIREFIRNNVEKLVPLINDDGIANLTSEQMVDLCDTNWLNICPKYRIVVLPLHLGDEDFADGVWIIERTLNIFINRKKEANETIETWNERKSKTLKNWYIPLMDRYTDW